MPNNRSKWWINVTVQTIGSEPLVVPMRKRNTIHFLYQQVTQSGLFGKDFALVTHQGILLSEDRKHDVLSQYIYEKDMREYLSRGREIGDKGEGVVLDLHFTVVKPNYNQGDSDVSASA